MLTPQEVAAKVQRLKHRNMDRDRRMSDVLAVRQGKMQDVFFGQFSDEYPKPLIANMVDIAARDLAEVTAPLPAINCSSSNMTSDAARRKSEIRTRIANHYANKSDLQLQFYKGADWYYTYGFCAGIVDIDFETDTPRIRLLDPFGLYYDKDRFGNVTCVSQTIIMDVESIIYQYPEHTNKIKQKYRGQNANVAMIRYHDKYQDMIFIPDLDNLVLSNTPNVIGRVLVDIAERPTVDGQARGQFDDVLPVQMAKARFALLQLEAAKKSVEAPIAIPPDVQEFALGPDALLRSNTPERIRRVPIELPGGVFAESSNLERELRMGSRYPEGRTGQIDASIVTGRGVQALMGGFDSQVKAAQAVFARFLINLIGIAFEVDEKVFPNDRKVIRGTDDGTPFELNYTPSRDIKGDYTVDVQYGLMAGLDPNRAAIFGLQLRGDKLISRDFLRRNLPFSINVTQEEQKVDIEDLRDSLRNAVSQYATAIPMLATQGGDPTEAVKRIADIIQGRQKGESLEQIVSKAFAPQEQPAATAMAPGASQPLPPEMMGMVPGAAPAAGSQMVAGPGQFSRRTDLAQGGSPQMSQLLAALTGAA
jgi:hypothetical protein